MSDDTSRDDWESQPEKTFVPVKGDCGHFYVVPVARLQDGGEFHCSVCGQADRFDEEGLREAQAQLEELKQQESPHGFASRLKDFITKGKGD